MRGERTIKRAWAVVLILVIPGLGHFYCGLLLYARIGFLGIVFLLAFAEFVTMGSFSMLAATAAIVVGWYVLLAVHAALMAQGVQKLHLKWWNRWYVFPIVIIAFLLLLEPLWTSTEAAHDRFSTYQFKSQSTHMWPTLNPDDRFLERFHFQILKQRFSTYIGRTKYEG